MLDHDVDISGGDSSNSRGAGPSITIFGPLTVTTRRELVDLTASRRTRNLLALLALARGRPVPADRLTDALWPEFGLDGSMNRLHVAISRLRRTLRAAGAPDLVIRSSEAYRLDASAVWVDLWDFERHLEAGRWADSHRQPDVACLRYEQALALAQGPLLEDEPYAEWALRARDSVARDVEATCFRLAQLHLEADRLLEASFAARRAVSLDELDESASALLITCYLGLQQPRLALAEYRRLERALHGTLGVRPSPSIRVALHTTHPGGDTRRGTVTGTVVRSAG